MNDRNIILTGLGIFVIVVLFPFWWKITALGQGDPPDFAEQLLPLTDQGIHCVRDTQFMRESHMDLLNDWRDEVVRDGVRFFTAADGYSMPEGRARDEKSLSQTCLRCHAKVEFCDRCHDYSAIVPNCWTCHVVPEGRG